MNLKLKYLSLVTLTGQNAVLGLSMRYARTRPGDMFISTTAVVMAETLKFFTCLLLVFNDEDRSVKKWWNSLYSTIVLQPMDTLKERTALFFTCSIFSPIWYYVLYKITNHKKIRLIAPLGVRSLLCLSTSEQSPVCRRQ